MLLWGSLAIGRWMKLYLQLLLILSSCVLRLSAALDGEVLETYTSSSGRMVEKIAFNDTQHDYVTVSYPKGFDASKSYHINFWYHGTSGKPTSGIEDSLESYIGVGMSYLDKDKVPPNGYATKHWESCLAVERNFTKRRKVKISRRIVSGVSKGGWMAYYMSLEPLEGLHGTGIIAAGMHQGGVEPIKSQLDHLAVFVGTGETDSNYPHAQMAVDFFKKSKIHSFCYEEWLEEGHVSIASPRTLEWLKVQGKRGGPKNLLVEYAEKVVQQKLEKIQKLEEHTQKYIAVRHLLYAPTAQYVSAQTKGVIKSLGKELTAQAEVKSWLIEYHKFRSMVQRETKFYHDGRREPELLGGFVKGYQKLALESAYPSIARRASYAYMRNLKNYTIEELKEEYLATTEYPSLKVEFDALNKKVSTSSAPSQEDINRRQELFSKIRTLALDAGMQGFYDVEWHKKMQPDAKVEHVIKSGRVSKDSVEAYSGHGF